MNARSSTTVPLPDVSTAESTYRTVDGVNLHVVAAGDPDDPLVVFLHGFPEFSSMSCTVNAGVDHSNDELPISRRSI